MLIVSGALEQFSSARHHLGFYHNVGISATYHSQGLTSVNLKALIFSALASLIGKHPILSVIPVNEDSAMPYFVRLPEINLEDAVTFMARQLPMPMVEGGSDIELDNILEEQHNTNFKEHHGRLPFWRVIILIETGVVDKFLASFIFHHALGDGSSGVAFHKDLLTAINTQCTVLKSTVIVPPTTDLLPTLEQALPFAVPPTAAQHIPNSIWTGGKICSPSRSHFRSLVFPKDVSEKLIQACRANSTTLTATLPVLIAVALTNNLPASFDELECTIPVSLRRYLPPSSPIDETSMGVWIDAFSSYYLRSNNLEFSWDEARRSRSKITQYLEKGGREVNVAKFLKVPDMCEYFLSKIGQERSSSFNVSNLGVLAAAAGKGDQWQAGRMVFSRTAFVAGSAIDFGVVTGADECIVLGYSWQQGVVTDELVAAVVEGVREGIESVAGVIPGKTGISEVQC